MNDTKTIFDLKDCAFIVPSYQRGYKWRKLDVRYLIDDLAEYACEKPYYLQPIVVAEETGKYILVDGQQRLTTFYLIWRYMYTQGIITNKKYDTPPVFSIEYSQRNYSTDYLKKNVAHTDVTPDIRRFKDAERVAEEVREILAGESFQKNFFEKATFLWYKLENSTEGPKMFERLNGKRIPLTDVELCKVLLLSPDVTPSTLRSERAMAWQHMEYVLQDNRFYAFICSEVNNAHDKSRMEILLSLVVKEVGGASDNSKEYIEYPVYLGLKRLVKQQKNVWSRLIHIFHVLEQWYEQPLYYNLIGFLVHGANVPISDIIADAASDNFDSLLHGRIKNWVGDLLQIPNMVYKDNKMHSMLLLYNILCDMYQKREPKSDKLMDRYGFNSKFPFQLYAADRYDKEHVHATNSESLRSGIEWQQWICNILKYTPEEQMNKLKQQYPETVELMRIVAAVMMERKEQEDESDFRERLNRAISDKIGGKEEFKVMFNRVNACIEEEKTFDTDYVVDEFFDKEQNNIGNLALLNVGINRDRAYAASPFAVKSAILMDRMREGYFVPKGTERMFTKAFRKCPSELYHWRKTPYGNGEQSDTEAFRNELLCTIERFVK